MPRPEDKPPVELPEGVEIDKPKPGVQPLEGDEPPVFSPGPPPPPPPLAPGAR